MTSVAVHPKILAVADEIILNRRHFHKHPELGFEEVKTAAYIVEKLQSYGITEIRTKVATTGIVATLRGSSPGKCIAFRADMDALPIVEKTGLVFESATPGKHHACGHDGHMSSLLAVARVLAKQADKIRGVVKFIFQPAEEGGGGAEVMVREGALEGVDEIYGIHLNNYHEHGYVGVKHGPIMASSGRFTIDVVGKGGHGGVPQGTVDAVVTAAQLVMALQTIVSRSVNPVESGVVTCGTIHGGFAPNVIADSVRVEGTIRAFHDKTFSLLKQRIREICEGIAIASGATINVQIHEGYPAVVNESQTAVAVVEAAAAKVVGAPRCGPPYLTMTSEDFSYFLQQRPGCFFFVGSNPGGDVPHHKSNFTFREEAMRRCAPCWTV